MANKMKTLVIPADKKDILKFAMEDICEYLSESFGLEVDDDETIERAFEIITIVLLASREG